MIKSMTGFGKASAENKNISIVCEIKSVNSKFLDLNIRMVPMLRDYEADIRNILGGSISRGKVDVNIQAERMIGDAKMEINQKMLVYYITELKKTAKQTNTDANALLASVTTLPEVFKNKSNGLKNSELLLLKKAVNTAVKSFDQYRISEGKALQKELTKRITLISNWLKSIESEDAKRIPHLRTKIMAQLDNLKINEKIDANRFEQEMIYYIEKLDITEEKIRLKTHLNYFLQTMNEENAGRKLGFIAQEIGREINTIGSKCNQANIQIFVVQMKDELEKIKEQLMNIL